MKGRKLPYRKVSGYAQYNPTFKAKARQWLKRQLSKLDRRTLNEEMKNDN